MRLTLVRIRLSVAEIRRTYQPAALDSTLDSTSGVSIHGLDFGFATATDPIVWPETVLQCWCVCEELVCGVPFVRRSHFIVVSHFVVHSELETGVSTFL